MEALPDMTPVPVITFDDLRAVFGATPAGRYPTKDLAARFDAWCESKGRPPAGSQRVSKALREAGASWRKINHGQGSWLISPEMFSGRSWFTETSPGDAVSETPPGGLR